MGESSTRLSLVASVDEADAGTGVGAQDIEAGAGPRPGAVALAVRRVFTAAAWRAWTPKSHARTAFLAANMCMPTLLMVIFILGVKNAVGAIVSFHAIALVAMPAAFLYRHHGGMSGITDFWGEWTARIRMQTALGTAGFVLVCGSMFGVYVAARKQVGDGPSERLEDLGVDFSESPALVALGALYFSLVNPVLEEIFWRCFLLREFGRELPEVLVESVCYAAYHIVVVNAVLGVGWSFLAFVLLVGAGGVFAFLTERFGVVASLLPHAGADTALALMVCNMAYGWI